MQVQQLTLLRLNKQEASLQRQPPQNALVSRDGRLNFHFCLYDLEGPYLNGFYHGSLQLPQNYPFQAPKLSFFTPSGRFECNTPICTSFTNFHPQSWTSAWNVRTLVLATISFMNSNEIGHGSRNDLPQIKREYAFKSLKFNLKNQTFVRLFKQKLIKIGKYQEQKVEDKQQQIHCSNEQIVNNSINNQPLHMLADEIHQQFLPKQQILHDERYIRRRSCKKIITIAAFMIILILIVYILD